MRGKIMELSKLQQNIIDKKNNKIIVISAAASGKSRMITEKARVSFSSLFISRLQYLEYAQNYKKQTKYTIEHVINLIN